MSRQYPPPPPGFTEIPPPPAGFSLVAAPAQPTQETSAAPPPPTGILSRFADYYKNQPQIKGPVEGMIGAAKELGSTGLNLLNLGRRAYMNPNAPDIPKPSWLEPQGGSEKLGAALATVGEYAIPSAAIGKIPAVAKLGILGRAGVEAGVAGTVGAARGETASSVARDALISGGITGVLGMLSKGATAAGEKIEATVLKPTKADLKGIKGPPEKATETMVQNLYKHDLGGTLQQSYQKATAKTTDLGTQLRAALASNPAAEVDLGQVLADTASELQASAPQNFMTNTEIKRALNKMLDEITTISPKTGKVNLADAQDMKQALGLIGSWSNGARDAESTAMEEVANAAYTHMRVAIENASGQAANVRAINQQFGEIIPIKNALIRQIPIAARKEVFTLKDAILLATGKPIGVGLAIGDVALRSGRTANALVQAGKNPAATAASIAPALTGVTATAADRLRSRMNP